MRALADFSLSRAQRLVLAAGSALTAAGVVGASIATGSLVRFFDNLHWTSSYLTAAVISLLGARRAEGTLRRSRTWFALGLGSYSVGQVCWDTQVALGWNPFPGPSDAFFMLLGPCLAAGVITHLGGRSLAERWAVALDVSAWCLVVGSWTLAWYLPRRGDLDLLTTAVLAFYPIVLIGAAGLTLIVFLGMQLRPTWSSSMFALSVLANGLLWMEWNSRTLDDALADGVGLNFGFSLAALAQGLSAATWSPRVLSSSAWERRYFVVLRALPLLLATVSALSLSVADRLPKISETALLVGTVFVVVLTVMRQSLLLQERDALVVAQRSAAEVDHRLRQLTESINEAMLIVDGADGRVSFATPAADRLFAGSPLGRSYLELLHADDRAFGAALSSLPGEGRREYRVQRGDGTVRWVRALHARTPIEGRDQWLVVLEDVTEALAEARTRVRLEQQLREAAKLESLGTLAGGVAHDFNNLLMAIVGNTELLRMMMTRDATAGIARELATPLDHIMTACERGRDLVRQIMAFSRKQDQLKSHVQVGEIVTEAGKLLRAAVPALIDIDVEVEPHLPDVLADPGQVHQVVMNLATNAAHAMKGQPGTLRIEVARRWIGRGENAVLGEGPYVEITVQDTGSGIAPQHMPRIFEPFFTTKGPQEGTGLGLAAVHGIVTTHGGSVEVSSELGVGTTFRVLLPSLEERASTAPAGQPRSTPLGDGRELLIVDDEPAIAQALASSLQALGWRSTELNDPFQALAVVAVDPSRFSLVITDGTMPGMHGAAFARRLRAIDPGLPVLLSTGMQGAFDASDFAGILQKPYRLETVAGLVSRAARRPVVSTRAAAGRTAS